MRIIKNKRIISLFCAAAMLFSVAALCGCADNTVAMSLGDYSLSRDDITYSFSSVKLWACTQFLSSAYKTYGDTETLWSSEAYTDTTLDEYFSDVALDNARNSLVESYLFDEYGLVLTDEQLATAKSTVNSYVVQSGGKGAFNDFFGYLPSVAVRGELASTRSAMLKEYLYGANAAEPISDDDRNAYYNANYIGFQFILIDTETSVLLDSDGNRVTDYTVTNNTDGSSTTAINGHGYKTVALDEAGVAAKLALIDEINEKLSAEPDSFAALASRYSEDYRSGFYPDGIFVESSYSEDFDEAVFSKLSSLYVGETASVATNNGRYVWILRRAPLLENAYKKEIYTTVIYDNQIDMFGSFESVVTSNVYQAKLNEYISKITEDGDFIGSRTMLGTHMPKLSTN